MINKETFWLAKIGKAPAVKLLIIEEVILLALDVKNIGRFKQTILNNMVGASPIKIFRAIFKRFFSKSKTIKTNGKKKKYFIDMAKLANK